MPSSIKTQDNIKVIFVRFLHVCVSLFLHFVKTGTNSPTGTTPGQQVKFRDCPGQTGTVCICTPENLWREGGHPGSLLFWKFPSARMMISLLMFATSASLDLCLLNNTYRLSCFQKIHHICLAESPTTPQEE